MVSWTPCAARSASTRLPSTSRADHRSSSKGLLIRTGSINRTTDISKSKSTLAGPTMPLIGAAER